MQMRTKQGLQTMRRAHAFLAGRAFTAAIGELKPQVDTLAAIIERLERHATDQEMGTSVTRAATDAKRAMANQLRQEYLRPIAQIARNLFADDAELRKSFLVKPPRDEEGLIQLASAFAERSAQFKDRFVEKGLASDFVERLQKAIEEFREVIVNRGLEQARRTAAGVGMREEVTRGRDLIRLVDAMLAPRLESRPEQLAEWRSIARFARAAAVTTEVVTAPVGPTAGPASPAVPNVSAPAVTEAKAA